MPLVVVILKMGRLRCTWFITFISLCVGSFNHSNFVFLYFQCMAWHWQMQLVMLQRLIIDCGFAVSLFWQARKWKKNNYFRNGYRLVLPNKKYCRINVKNIKWEMMARNRINSISSELIGGFYISLYKD